MRLSFKFYLASIVIGIIGGAICVAFRYLILLLHDIRLGLFKLGNHSDFQRISNAITTDSPFYLLLKYLILFVFIVIFLNIVNFIVKEYPTTTGSGLPQTKALLEGKITYKSPFKNIIAKFIGGILSIASGLSFGREGSSVQMGSLIGYIFGRCFKVKNDDNNYLIAAGAGAGVAAAFTAPLASSILILESLRNTNTSDVKKLTTATLLSGLCAGIIASVFFPKNIYSSISITKPDLKELQSLIIFMIMALTFSILGKIFSKLFIYIKTNYEQFQTRHDKYYLMLALLICAVTFFYPSLIGGNQVFIIEIINNDGFGFFNNMIIIIILSTLSIISNATGFPGGLFIPLLSLGALLGKIFCITLAEFDIVNLSNTGYFVLIGMSVFLISVVRTPLTGFILISEMTGNYELLFPTLVVGILTYIFTEIMRVKGLDDILYDMMFSKNQ